MLTAILAILCMSVPFKAYPAPGTRSSQPVYSVAGEVIDSLSGEGIPLANIYVSVADGGCLADDDGRFRFKSSRPIKSLIVSSMGYSRVEVGMDTVNPLKLRIVMLPSTTTLEEVLVKPKKQKYSRRNNPAVELMQKIRAASRLHDPKDSAYYAFDKYEKMVIGLSDFQIPDSGSRTARRMPFLADYIDSMPHASKPVLKISVKEKAASHLFTAGDHKGKEIITGLRSEGLDKSFDQANIQAALEDSFREIDIFKGDVNILQNRFVSPLSPIGPNYYKYYLDTVPGPRGSQLLELQFVPHNPQSMGFNGRMWVALGDTAYFVNRLEMQVPKSINLNFVKDLYIEQDFIKGKEGQRHPKTDFITVLFQLIPGTQGVYARRETTYSGHRFGPDRRLAQFYDEAGSRFLINSAEEQNDVFWTDVRPGPLPKAESEMGSFILRLRKMPLFYWGEKILTILVQGYVGTGKKSRFDIGPVNTFVSTNKAEGVRFRLGGMTTANLSPHWFARGYVAYGLRDHKFKYRTELEYSFKPKKYHSREWPMHSIRASYQYDTDRLGEHYLFTNPDNIFLSIKRKGSCLITYRGLAEAKYIQEFPFNLSIEAGLRAERQTATRWVPFLRTDSASVPHFRQAAIFVSLRWAPGEKFVQSASQRKPLNMDAPIFQLTHEYGPRKLFGADFTINKTEFSFQKRFWFSAFGYLNTIVKLGKIWSSVYYPALLWQNANLSYTIQPESYALLNPMEFAMDEYFSLGLDYFGNGILFNRIPLVKKLRLREVITFRGFMGHLSKRNNPQYNDALFRFPADANTGLMHGALPYMEVSAGIDNIASILRVDYVWRLTYRDRPFIDHSGVRISLHFSF